MNHFFLYFQQVKFIGNQNTSTGNSSYELTNLPITIGIGNVLTSISDLVYPMSSGGTDVDYYKVGINQVTDYSPFGVQLDGRTISGGIDGNDVRYGFQNQEMDNEIKGEGNSINFEYRMHDPRIGRFFAIDPFTADFPNITPYQFASNSPIYLLELEGMEGVINQSVLQEKEGKTVLVSMSSYVVERLTSNIVKTIVKDKDGNNIRFTYTLETPKGGWSPTVTKNISQGEKPLGTYHLNKLFGNNLGWQNEQKPQKPKESPNDNKGGIFTEFSMGVL